LVLGVLRDRDKVVFICVSKGDYDGRA